jgi:hypothetical protein
LGWGRQQLTAPALMCRFAFLEAVVILAAARVPAPPALAKLPPSLHAERGTEAETERERSGEARDLAGTLRRLVRDTIVPALAERCAPPNEFRRERLYTFEVDRVLVQHLPLLQARRRSPRLSPRAREGVVGGGAGWGGSDVCGMTSLMKLVSGTRHTSLRIFPYY